MSRRSLGEWVVTTPTKIFRRCRRPNPNYPVSRSGFGGGGGGGGDGGLDRLVVVVVWWLGFGGGGGGFGRLVVVVQLQCKLKLESVQFRVSESSLPKEILQVLHRKTKETFMATKRLKALLEPQKALACRKAGTKKGHHAKYQVCITKPEVLGHVFIDNRMNESMLYNLLFLYACNVSWDGLFPNSSLFIVYHPHPKNSTFIGKPNWLVAWYGLILNDCNTLRFREWNQFVGNEASEISKPVATKPIIIETHSKVVSYKGISLSTKSSTSFIINPNTYKPIALRSWSTLNGSVLQDIISKKPYLTYASGSTSLTSENVLKIDQIKGSLGKETYF
ncbi:hypothetical protein Q3G72_008196 [Acer saccharum]|nr:hypothetical protein Q3G72_008196 [Acer saccharum]